jgi:hypothetical protein
MALDRVAVCVQPLESVAVESACGALRMVAAFKHMAAVHSGRDSSARHGLLADGASIERDACMHATTVCSFGAMITAPLVQARLM